MAEFTDEQYGLDQNDQELLASLGGQSPDGLAQPDFIGTDPNDLVADPAASPVMEGPQLDPNQELPGGVLDSIAETPSPVPDEPLATPAAPATSEQTIRKQGNLEQQQAQTQIEVAQQQSEAARQHNMDMRLAYADYLERRQAAEQNLDRKVKELDAAKLEDPRKQDVWKNRIAVIFGGLGAGLAGGSNQGLEAVQKKWHDQTEMQKVNIGLLQDRVAMARTGVKDADLARRELNDAANAQLISNYNTAIKQGELQLKKLGIPAAEIAQDERLQKLQQGKAAAIALARKQNDEHELAQSLIKLRAAQASKAARKGSGGGGGNAAAEAILTKMAESGASLGEITDKAAALKVPKAGDVARKIKAAVGLDTGRKEKLETDEEEKTVHVGVERKPAKAPTKKDATEYRVFESSAQQVEQAIDALEKNYKEYGVEITSALPSVLQTRAAKERASAMEALVLPAKEVGRLGALAGPDKAILTNITGGSASQLLGDPEGLKTIRAWLQRARSGALNSLGIAPEPSKKQNSPAPAKGGANNAALDAEARKVLADPGSYSPKARAKAAEHLKKQLDPIVL